MNQSKTLPLLILTLSLLSALTLTGCGKTTYVRGGDKDSRKVSQPADVTVEVKDPKTGKTSEATFKVLPGDYITPGNSVTPKIDPTPQPKATVLP